MRDTYWRRARLERVVDGDTIQVVIDLGFYTSVEHRLRLLGVDTPEMNDLHPAKRARAVAAKDFISHWLAEHAAHGPVEEWPLHIRTEKADSFGRFLVELECGQGHSLNDALIETGHARPWPPS